MKKITIITILLCALSTTRAQQGQFAGKHKALINTVYTDSRNIAGLSEWTFVEASVLSPVNDPAAVMVDVFKKGTTFLVFFSTQADSASPVYTIADVLEIGPVTKGWVVETSFCQLNNFDDPWIVAWAKVTPTEYLKKIKKAWRFDREKKQIEIMPVAGIGCLNESFDTY